jgi:hypothetical protein
LLRGWAQFAEQTGFAIAMISDLFEWTLRNGDPKRWFNRFATTSTLRGLRQRIFSAKPSRRSHRPDHSARVESVCPLAGACALLRLPA